MLLVGKDKKKKLRLQGFFVFYIALLCVCSYEFFWFSFFSPSINHVSGVFAKECISFGVIKCFHKFALDLDAWWILCVINPAVLMEIQLLVVRFLPFLRYPETKGIEILQIRKLLAVLSLHFLHYPEMKGIKVWQSPNFSKPLLVLAN